MINIKSISVTFGHEGYIMTELGDRISSEDKEFLTAAVFMGMLAGGMCVGFISDTLGRKKALLISLGINFIAGKTYLYVFVCCSLILTMRCRRQALYPFSRLMLTS